MATLKETNRSEYQALVNAIHRCTSPKHKQFKDYGGRGIEMYNGWVGRDGFASFLEHIGPKPAPHYTLDRIDNNKGYVPGNVRWATRSEQQTNRRVKAVVVMIAGRTQSLQQWSIETGINTHTLASRYTRGKTGEDLIRPVADGYKRHV